MARIPTPALRGQAIGSVQSQFTPTPFQNLNPDKDVFGAAQARMMQQASKSLDVLASDLKKSAEDDDTLALLKTQEDSNAFEIRVMNDALNLKQGNAIGVADNVLSEFNAYKASIKPASTQAGRLAQQRHMLQLKSSISSRASSHERTEVFNFKAGKVAGAVAAAQNQAGLNWNNPDIINRSVEIVTAQTGNLADMKGVTDPEARSLAIKAGVSKTYMSALRGAVAGQDYTTAKKLLDTAIEKDGLTAEDKEAALKLVQGATVQGESQSEADRIMATPGSPEQRLAMARKITDSAIRAATVELVSGRNREEAATKIRVRKERFEAAQANAIRGIRPSLVDIEGMTNTQIEYLRNAAEYAKAEDRGENRRPPGEVDAVAEYRKKSVVPGYLANVDLDDFAVEYEFKVSKTQYDLMVDEVVSAKLAANTLAAAEAKKLKLEKRNIKMSATAVAKLKQTFKALNKDLDPVKGDAGIKAFLAWQLEFDKRVLLENATTEAAKADIINRMTLSKVITDKSNLVGGTDDVGYAFALDADQIKLMARKEFDFSDDEEAAFIDAFPVMVNSLRVQRVPATNDSIGSTFKTLFSATNQLPRDQRVNFLAEYTALTKKIREAGGALTARNYLSAWEQFGGRLYRGF